MNEKPTVAESFARKEQIIAVHANADMKTLAYILELEKRLQNIEAHLQAACQQFNITDLHFESSDAVLGQYASPEELSPMRTMFEETTVEMAREAAEAINQFMAHWNDDVSDEYHESDFHGAKITRIARIMAIPEYQGDTTTLWEATFDKSCGSLCFEIRDGIVHFPHSRTFAIEG